MSWDGDDDIGGGDDDDGNPSQLWSGEFENTDTLRELAVESAREHAAVLAEERANELARDRERLLARSAEMQQRMAVIGDVETKTEYRRAIERTCIADGQSAIRKRGATAVASARSIGTPQARAVGMRLFQSDEWIWQEREAAHAVTDEDLAIQQHLLSLVNGMISNSLVAPPRGTNRTCAVAPTISAMRLQSWMLVHTPPLFTTNVVATAHFGTTINALTLVNRIAGASFNPRCFAAVKLRVHGSTHLIFSGGLVVCTGSKSPDNARVACIDTAQLLMRVGIHAQFLNFAVRNVVSTSNTGFEVDLAALAHTYPINAHYVSDSFPGLTFRIAQSRMVMTVFKSGCCVLTGVKSRCDAMVAWTWLYCNILWHFQVRAGNGAVSDTEYGRRARQDESMVEQVCESVCDITQSLFAMSLADDGEHPPPPLPSELQSGDQYFAELCQVARGASDSDTAAPPPPPRLDLEAWLSAEAARTVVSQTL